MNYIAFDDREQLNGRRETLQAQAEILTMAEHQQNYKRLRKKAHDTKLLFHKKMDELKYLISGLGSHFPQRSDESEHENLKSEIEQIQKRISALTRPSDK